VNLETTIERTTPTGAQWVAWTQQEPALADLAYQEMRWQLRTAGPARKDELLGALVRLVQTDPAAFGVLAACLLPSLRHRSRSTHPRWTARTPSRSSRRGCTRPPFVTTSTHTRGS
jgi:hypothetical protein